ncbi:MAG: XTP/dITP diphosphatase [Terrimicrobiaceae bacterium]
MAEIAEILGDSFEVNDLSAAIGVPVVEETGSTFEENATLKAVLASLHWEGWVIADDSGLEVDALGGEPGVRSARYAGEEATDEENNSLLLERLSGREDRSARFRCVIVLARAGRKLASFEGSVEGTLLRETKGKGGFGYDPLFVPSGFESSFAELSPATKNQLSHRSRALSKLKSWQGFF